MLDMRKADSLQRQFSRKPYCVVLFDEIEKAHPDVFNVLLQVLDDGRITDSQGRTVDFKNTILIMTSNIGSPYLLDGIDENGEIKEEAQKEVMDDLRGHFRPEFLNRLDEIILFKPLTKDNIGSIVDLMVKELNDRLADQELSLELTDAAKKDIIDQWLRSCLRCKTSEALSSEICRDTDCQKNPFRRSPYRRYTGTGCGEWRVCG